MHALPRADAYAAYAYVVHAHFMHIPTLRAHAMHTTSYIKIIGDMPTVFKQAKSLHVDYQRHASYCNLG
jgi:hypothetical protein